jgi:8-oxo-dGTP pyrophosphatase MutT (NUDIX family)
MLFHAAGVLPYCAGHVLLGLEARGWSAFSGTAHVGEAPRETALREFHEETAHLFAPSEDHPAIDLTAASCIVTTTPRSRVFYLFLYSFACTGPPLGPRVNEAFQFKRHRTTVRHEREKLKLMWVPIDDISALRLSPSFRADMPEIMRALREEAARASTGAPVDAPGVQTGAVGLTCGLTRASCPPPWVRSGLTRAPGGWQCARLTSPTLPRCNRYTSPRVPVRQFSPPLRRVDVGESASPVPGSTHAPRQLARGGLRVCIPPARRFRRTGQCDPACNAS